MFSHSQNVRKKNQNTSFRPSDLPSVALENRTVVAGLACLLLFLPLGLINVPRDSHNWKRGSKPEQRTKNSGPHRVQQLSCCLVVN